MISNIFWTICFFSILSYLVEVVLKPGDKGEDMIGLFFDVLDIGVSDIQLDWLELGKLKYKNGQILL